MLICSACPLLDRNEGDTTNYWTIGAISFALTMVNIICILLAGTFAFKLKEVAPIKEKVCVIYIFVIITSS